MCKLKKLIRKLGLQHIDYIVIAIAIAALAWEINDVMHARQVQTGHEYLAGN
jgi:hypothetical protein